MIDRERYVRKNPSKYLFSKTVPDICRGLLQFANDERLAEKARVLLLLARVPPLVVARKVLVLLEKKITTAIMDADLSLMSGACPTRSWRSTRCGSACECVIKKRLFTY